VILALGLAHAGAAHAQRSAIFGVTCADSHRSMDDPIVHPGRPGAAHMHEFTGSWSTNAFSTADSMRRSGTSCHVSGDTAGYWTPTMYGPDGRLIRKGFSTAYFSGNHKDRTKIVPFPAGLKVIADMAIPRPSHVRPAGTAATAPPRAEARAIPPRFPTARTSTMGQAGSFSTTPVSADHRSHMSWATSNQERARQRIPYPCLGCT